MAGLETDGIPYDWDYIVNHIFLPPQLPQEDDFDIVKEHALCKLVEDCAEEYAGRLPPGQRPRWNRMTKMLKNLRISQVSISLTKECVNQAISEMKHGDVVAFLIHAQNAGIILRKSKHKTIFESFEVSPSAAAVMGAQGKLLCSYPGPAIAVFSDIVADPAFREELASFLMQMDADNLDSAATTKKAQTTIIEERDTAHPRYITQLLTGVLRGMGEPADIRRIQKRIADDVLWKDTKKPWRRSPLWLVIRVTLQTSLFQEQTGHEEYKAFMVFMMARLLRRLLRQSFVSDLLFCIRAKISRRLHKLGDTPPNFVKHTVLGTVELTEKELQDRWSAIQTRQAMAPRWAPGELDLGQDAQITLLHSKPYLLKVLQGRMSKRSSKAFRAKHPSRCIDNPNFRLYENGGLLKFFASDPAVALIDFEMSVQNHLDGWIASNLCVESACSGLGDCLKQYAEAAMKYYKANPEAQSVMLLTIFELWVALDKLVIAQCPLLQKYSPEIPLGLLHPLLIRHSKSLARLAAIELYISERHRRTHPGRSIFTDAADKVTFAVCYFEQSPYHQSLKLRIEQDANLARQKKLEELELQNAKYQTLTERSESTQHLYRINRRGVTIHHTHGCQRCALESQIRGLHISVHEWPLSEDPLKAAVAVFELACPRPFAAWRAATYYVLRDISSHTKDSKGAKPPMRLDTYPSFSPYLVPTGLTRITLASATKSFKKSHYQTVRIPTDASSVCLKNALQFKLYDKDTDMWVAEPFECGLEHYCTSQLPRDGPYRGLQFAVDDTSHESNRIISKQFKCPTDLDLHEYIAFAHLRSGHQLQWLNIAREIRSRSLSFHKAEVYTLITQAAWQVGNLSQDGGRECHTELGNTEFCLVLLQELNELLQSVQANWQEVITVRTLIALTSRLLATTDSSEVKAVAYDLLRSARITTFGWLNILCTKMQNTDDENTVREFQLRICEMAATCRGTFDVETDHFSELLASAEDITIAVQCAILVHDNSPLSLSNAPYGLKRLLDRDARLSHSLEHHLRRLIEIYPDGVDCAITALWTAFRPGSDWNPMPSPNERWIIAMSAVEPGQQSQYIQLNILKGELLVDGDRLGRLPGEIVAHPTYLRILGQKVLDIIPANMPDMDYATRFPVSDYQLFFAMKENNLVIRAKRELDSEILELVPHKKLTGDFPDSLIHNCVHWLQLSNGQMELRPINSLWKSSPNNWVAEISAEGHSTMHQGSSRLIDVHSPSFRMISACLKPLEYTENLVVTWSPDTRQLSVELPRFRLSFFLNSDGHLECQNLPGMVIDSNQSTGTMIGLSSQLVICAKGGVATQIPRSRRVIIPYGHVQYSRKGNHSSIVIETKSQPTVKYLEYKVDADLGRLVGNVSLTSKLYKIYLHAVSSHCLPDPLTGYTGTEEALRELRSATCHSFQNLAADEMDILHLISALAPVRSFYPHGMRVMQRVDWSDLQPTAQHCNFYAISQSILEHADRLCVFHTKSISEARSLRKGSRSDAEVYLLERARLRMAFFVPVELAGILPSDENDAQYLSRDVPDPDSDGIENESAAFAASDAIHQWKAAPDTSLNLLATFEGWEHLAGLNQDITLSYSRDWLQLNLAEYWISLYELCRGSSKARDRFRMVFSFSSLAYAMPTSRQLIPTLLVFATTSRFRQLASPSSPYFNLSKGFSPQEVPLVEMIQSFALDFEASPEAEYDAYDGESEIAAGERRFESYEARIESQIDELVDNLVGQWPCEEPIVHGAPSDGELWRFDIQAVADEAGALFNDWFHNWQLRLYTNQVQAILNALPSSESPLATAYYFLPCHSLNPPPPPTPSSTRVTVDCLMQRTTPLISSKAWSVLGPKPFNSGGSREPGDSSRLRDLVSEFQDSTNAFCRLYGEELDKSRRNMDDETNIPSATIPYSLDELVSYRDDCCTRVHDILNAIKGALSPTNLAESTLSIAGLWPRFTTRSLLQMMALNYRAALPHQWENILVSLAKAMLFFQRSQRLLRWAVADNPDEFTKEMESMVYGIQDSLEFLDWLLIQVDNDFLARPLQVRVAREMIAPHSAQNTLLQLNMGEGKSSVIVPMVASALADGQKLTRVVVLKSLSRQMFHLLVERLSGMANRQIFYLPFSRSVKVDAEQASLIHDLYMQCMRVGGILIVQPEHLLSFKLMGLERLLASAFDRSSEQLITSQRWLEKNSRDILDESDEILHIRYQLIYTMGQQRALEDHPDRWIIIQQVLALAQKHACIMRHRFPLHIEARENVSGGYPFIRILSDDAGAAFISSITQDILAGALSEGPIGVFPADIRQAAIRLITDTNVPVEDAQLVQQYGRESGSWGGLLLLRGLLAHGILLYAFKERRWRVDYGLDLSRTLLAVPYRAKDVPALRAEFGHPDVAIVLTCLSYSYGGLNKDQLDTCLQLLFKLDNPSMEYEKWVNKNESVPENLQQLSGINLSDPEQRDQFIFPLFHLNPAVIDFYLASVVFPKEAKEFPEKLTTSGWDIAEKKTHVTTGFSGTNDNQYLLPTAIAQRDPLQQLGTNAKVLTYLLRPENNHYICVRTQTTKQFLKLLTEQTPAIRVLLDVGAQMLDMQNVELAKHWLSLVQDIPAVLFFGLNDEASILTRDGTIEPFISSSFNQQLDKCLVYLDDVHTRGTDLKLPRDSRAAVTLGPKVTKDRLVQGCMRMRQLGNGQSVIFFAPPEVDRAMREAAKPPVLSLSQQVRAVDILRWTMLGTCADIQHHVPHWAQQAVDHQIRSSAWQEFCSSEYSEIGKLKSAWLQTEARTLEAMYGPSRIVHHVTPEYTSEIQQRCRMLGVHSLSDVRMEEEQEREVDHEIERERQVQRPSKAEAATHILEGDVRQFVLTGDIPPESSSFIPISTSLAVSTGTKHGANSLMWSPNLLATKDFSTTIWGSPNRTSDYLRPTHWIISSAKRDSILLVIMSPYEVNLLLPEIRKSKSVHLHMHAPRVTYAMKPFDDLKFFCIPSLRPFWVPLSTLLTLQIHLLSGQLYLSDYAMYRQLCEFLGLYTADLSSVINFRVQHDGFIKPINRHRVSIMPKCPFPVSPVSFLKELYAMRRKGLGYSSTHMGKILRGRLLTKDDFQ